MATHKIGEVVLLETARTAKHYGYALLDDDDVVFYIGRSCDPSARLRQHVYSGSHLIRERLQKNRVQRLRILAGPMSESEAEDWEKATIRTMLLAGVTLLNQESKPSTSGKSNRRHPTILKFAGIKPRPKQSSVLLLGVRQ